MTPSLASTTWDDYHRPPAPKRIEPETPKAIDVIHFKATKENIEITYYLEGILKEQFKSVDIDTLRQWAIDDKNLLEVYELPCYNSENDEEYTLIYPATSETGTAEQINQARLDAFIKGLTAESIEIMLEKHLHI